MQDGGKEKRKINERLRQREVSEKRVKREAWTCVKQSSHASKRSQREVTSCRSKELGVIAKLKLLYNASPLTKYILGLFR